MKYVKVLIDITSKFYGRHHDFVKRYGICVRNDHGYVPLVVSISRSFPHS